MDNQITKYQIADAGFRQRAEQLAKLDSLTLYKMEAGVVSAILEDAVNSKNWLLVEKLTALLVKCRESELKAKKETGRLVDVEELKQKIIGPLSDCIANRVQEFCPTHFEDIIDAIEIDIKTIFGEDK